MCVCGGGRGREGGGGGGWGEESSIVAIKLFNGYVGRYGLQIDLRG